MKLIKQLLFSCLLLSALTYSPFAQANTKSTPTSSLTDFSIWGRTAILDEGRIKPLDTYARTILLQFSGKRTFDRKPAIQWFAKLLFTPWETANDKIFLINSPEIPMAMHIEPDQHRRYSYTQLLPGLTKLKELAEAADGIDPKERSVVDQEIVRIYNNVSLYVQLHSAFSFTIPDDDFTITQANLKTLLELPVDQTQFSFLDIALKADLINEETRDLDKKKSSGWSANDRELMKLLSNLYKWANNASGAVFPIMPPLNTEGEAWQSPWDAARLDFSSPQARKEFAFIQSMANAYRSGQKLEFNITAKAFNLSIQGRVSEIQQKECNKIPLEIFYNHSNLFSYAWIFYILAFFAFLFSLIWPSRLLHTFGFACISPGFIPHVAALILRMLIMSRPPVTNLYETFVFVGVITVLLSILTELVNKKWLGIVVGSISGFVFLAIADKFSAEGDTLRMLVAVLNSNFWLSTHVLSITIGYSGCCVAGIMGHVYILQALLRPKDKAMLETTYRHILGILGFGLTMAFLGTMLGGIWADQSWGRFWGWDPKENGALLIVLWTSIVFHAKVGRMIRPLGVAVGASFGLLVVMWAWFGVNLLSIGLHSYGFTSGIANNLLIYAASEILFLTVSIIILRKRGIPL